MANGLLKQIIDASRIGQARRAIEKERQELEAGRPQFPLTALMTPEELQQETRGLSLQDLMREDSASKEEQKLSLPGMSPEEAKRIGGLYKPSMTAEQFARAAYAKALIPKPAQAKRKLDIEQQKADAASKKNVLYDPISKVIPGMTDKEVEDQFGKGVTNLTPFAIANQIGKSNLLKSRTERMFPVSALSVEGQAAAQRAGLPDFIPMAMARAISGANPVKLPSYEESTALATATSIQDKINNVAELLPTVGDSALGFGTYHINKYGQYIPGIKSDPNIVRFYTNINSINNAMIYYMSGKQINEEESKRIKAELLEPELNKDAFAERLATVIDNFSYLRNLKDRAITGVGKRNPMLKEEKSNVGKTVTIGNVTGKIVGIRNK